MGDLYDNPIVSSDNQDENDRSRRYKCGEDGSLVAPRQEKLQLTPRLSHQSVVAAALVQVRLLDPVPNRLLRSLELPCKRSRTTPGSHKFYDPLWTSTWWTRAATRRSPWGRPARSSQMVVLDVPLVCPVVFADHRNRTV